MPTQKKTTTSKPAQKAVTKPAHASQQAKKVAVSKDAQVAVTTEIKAPKGKNGRKRIPKPNVQVFMDTDDFAKAQVSGFVGFLREHSIVGLAVGFVAGSQAQTVVKQLISSFIDPSFQLFFGGAKLSERTFTLHLWHNSAKFGWGGMMYALINLIFVLAIIYALIKIFKLDRLDKPKE